MKMKMKTVLISAAFAAAAAAVSTTQAQVVYSTVARSGEAAPGAGNGAAFAGFNGARLNDAGQAVFVATLGGGGVNSTNNSAIYSGSPGSLMLAARSGDTAPGAPASTKYQGFISPLLNNAGQLAFRATLNDVGGSSQGIFTGAPSSIALVARTGTQAPGAPAGVNYRNNGFEQDPSLNNAGRVTYYGGLTGDGVTAANRDAIFAGPASAPALVARSGDPLPGAPAGTNYGSLGIGPLINDQGGIAYGATIGGPLSNVSVALAGPPNSPTLVARTGDRAPGTPVGINYGRVRLNPNFNNAGQVEFITELQNGSSGAGNAIYAGPAGSPALVARSGTRAPGAAGGANFSGFFLSPSLNNAGHVAFVAELTNGTDAIYAGDPGSLSLVARTGTAAPGVRSRYLSLENPAYNDAGQAAYLADLTGTGVAAANDRALFLYDPILGSMLIAREGDAFDLGGGVSRTIADQGIGFISTGEFNPSNSRTGLADHGGLVFTLQFTDGSSGVFAAAVPEPTSLVLLGFACIGVTARRRRV